MLHADTYFTHVPAGLLGIFALWATLGVPAHSALLVHAGMIFGSLLYDAMHYSFHHGPDLQFGWYQQMKTQHMRHHFRDNSKEFGVTTSLWDWAFGTLAVPLASGADKMDKMQ